MKDILSKLPRSIQGRLSVLAPIALGLFAGLLAWSTLRARTVEATAGWELEDVVVASRALDAGQVVGDEDLARRAMPARFVGGSVLRPEQVRLVVGQRLEAPIQAGEPLLWTHFAVADGAGGLARTVQAQGRAVTVQVGEAASVGGWVRPNDHVDVLSTFRDPQSHDLATTTLLQNVLVLATGTPDDPGSSGTATVLVLPEEAELLALAQQMGSLSLALRNPDDLEIRDDRSRTTARTLLTGERTAELQRRREATIQVIRGRARGGFDGGTP